MSQLKTLLVQPSLRWKDPAENRAHLEGLIVDDAGDADLVVLPETFATGFLGDSDLPLEDMSGPTVQWMTTIARQHDCGVAGSAVITENGLRFNRLVLATPDGVAGYYDKRHLFTFAGEDRRYTAGEERVILDFRGWRINLQVCYDLRFPAWCRNHGDYDLMLLVANWPSTRVMHWSSLLQARAIENQTFVIGVNRVGQDGNGLEYPGQSVVHDPSGNCLANLGSGETVELVEMDLADVEKTQKKFPFLADDDP